MEKIASARRAVSAFQEILDEDLSPIVRDATIQRFEFTFEACWKALKWFLKQHEGIARGSTRRDTSRQGSSTVSPAAWSKLSDRSL